MDTLQSARTPGAIRADQVSKQFRGGVVALQEVSVTVPLGSFSAFIGPSGCGKSTLLRIVAGLLPATSGTVLVDEQPVDGPRDDVGIMFQKPTLLPWKNVMDNVLLPRHLSGGMAQRVALARLLMIGAKFMLLDEPFGALDEFTRERLNLELMRVHATANLTTMLVTHNITEAILLSDRVVVMSARPGRIAGVVDVPFDHPRSIELTRTSEFGELVFQVRDLLGEALDAW